MIEKHLRLPAVIEAALRKDRDLKGTKPQLREAEKLLHTVEAPDWLSEEARKEWDRVTPTSAKIGAFSKAFAGGLVGGVVATAFAGLSSNIMGTMKGIAQLGNEAKRAGISAQAFQEWLCGRSRAS